ncbi:hypothetical protein AAH118_12535, partial [Parabacteroides distasonis]
MCPNRSREVLGVIYYIIGIRTESEVYVIGGYVRDIFLNRPSKDIDVVAV